MKNRKTIALLSLVEATNKYLACDSPYITRDMRLGAAGLLETALHSANAYDGFNYLGGYEGAKKDDSRRIYYLGAKNRA